MKTIAFAGFRHGHIMALYSQVNKCSHVKIAGAWEEDETAKNEAIKYKGVDFCFDTYEQMLDDDGIDIIAIGDYYGRRGTLAIQALKAGKHVIADKPICTSLAELDEIERLSKEKGLKVGCLLSLRYSNYAATAKRLIDEGKIGEIHAVSFNGQHPLSYGERPGWYFEKGKHGGVINDLSVHGIDLVEYLTGKRLREVNSARCWNAFADKEPDFKDCAQFMVTLDGGCGLLADVSYAVAEGIPYGLPFYWQFIIWGEKGVLRFAENGQPLEAYLSGASKPKLIRGTKTQKNHIKDFLNEIDGKGTPTVTTQEVFASSRDTLLIQAAADKLYK